MHFWIDKRSSYGIGYNRSMTHLSYQHRRVRSKSIATQVRQQTSTPSLPQTPEVPRANQQRAPTPNVLPLNAQHVPVIHSVYNREPAVNHLVESIDSSRISNHWLPIYLKSGICIAMAITLLALKLYYDNDIKVFHLVWLGVILIVLLITSIVVSSIRMRRSRDAGCFTTTIVEPPETSQTTMHDIHDEIEEPPPPYAIAVKTCSLDSPPPPYEKISII